MEIYELEELTEYLIKIYDENKRPSRLIEKKILEVVENDESSS